MNEESNSNFVKGDDANDQNYVERDEVWRHDVVHRARNCSHNPDKLVLLSPKHPYTKLILKSFHDINHRGVAYTVARSRLRYWIPQATKIMKGIKKNCVQCRLLSAKAMEQIMSPLPALRTKPAPAWFYSMIYHIWLDLSL